MHAIDVEPFAMAEQYLIKAEHAARAIEAAGDDASRAHWQGIANAYLLFVQAILDVVPSSRCATGATT